MTCISDELFACLWPFEPCGLVLCVLFLDEPSSQCARRGGWGWGPDAWSHTAAGLRPGPQGLFSLLSPPSFDFPLAVSFGYLIAFGPFLPHFSSSFAALWTRHRSLSLPPPTSLPSSSEMHHCCRPVGPEKCYYFHSLVPCFPNLVHRCLGLGLLSCSVCCLSPVQCVWS